MTKTHDNMGQILSKTSIFDGAIPYDQISHEDFLSSIKKEMSKARAKLDQIKQSSVPTFENTLLVFETFAEDVEAISTVFSNLFSAEASEEIKKISKEMALLQSDFSSDLFLDQKIFERVDELFEKKDTLGLNSEQKRLLTETHRSFVRNGAKLNEEQKKKIRTIDQELSKLTTQFKENVQEATNEYVRLVKNESELAGLSPEFKAQLQEEAKKRGHEKEWALTLHAPTYVPFMEMGENAKLREELYRAYNGKCIHGKYSNEEVIQKIVNLRKDRAQLLGFSSHADFVLDDRMVQNTKTAQNFLEKLRGVSLSAAKKEMNELSDYKKQYMGSSEVFPWDTGFIVEKLTQLKFDVNQEELKPYFGVQNVLKGMFGLAKRLYGIELKERQDIPVYHKDVQVFEVTKSTNQYVGLLYVDLYQRESKRAGAWMTQFRNQGLFQGKVCRPHISIVMNFSKGLPNEETFLRFDDVNTLFHEFGHALHGLLSDVTYRSLSGTSVTWDFVELPSQFMENWLLEKEVFYSIAKHGKTGAAFPEETYKKLVESQKFMAGWMSLRQVQFALLDLAWHSQQQDFNGNVLEFEREVTSTTRLLKLIENTSFSAGFQHIFAGGYSAGYYSYKWAEVLDADAFEHFKMNGLFNENISKSFYENILSKGNTEDAMELYKKFRGQEPDPNALLRRSGLIST
ncbi:MAG: M3 family metallopeptidase [Bdellovibrionales bacterium]